VLTGQALYELDLKAFDEDEKQRRIEERYQRRVASFNNGADYTERLPGMRKAFAELPAASLCQPQV
jgi:hypothetical protein